MCFPISKLPQKENKTGSPKGNVQSEERELKKEIEKATRHPLSVGKHRNRATAFKQDNK